MIDAASVQVYVAAWAVGLSGKVCIIPYIVRHGKYKCVLHPINFSYHHIVYSARYLFPQ